MNVIPQETYWGLWYDPNIHEDLEDKEKTKIDPIEIEEIEETLRTIENQKAPRLNGIRSALLNYGGWLLDHTIL